MKKKINSVSPYRPDPIPPFKTLDEEANFWDTHDTSEIFKNPNTLISKLPKLKVEVEDDNNPKLAF
jgi:hypothetical protein